MTDLKITKFCAKAMGLRFRVMENGFGNEDVSLDGVDLYDEGSNMWNLCYSPLSDDAQAMALVKKFGLMIDTMADPKLGWMVLGEERNEEDCVINIDLNRAICECVARMQQAKVPA